MGRLKLFDKKRLKRPETALQVINLPTLANYSLHRLGKRKSTMTRNKKIFLALFLIFMLIMLWIGYDISSRTTFPGSKGNLKERISTETEQKKN